MGKPFCRKNNQGLPRWYIYVTYKGQRVRKVAGKTKTEALRYQRKWENRLERDKGASIRDKKIPFDFLCGEYLKWAANNLGKQTLRERLTQGHVRTQMEKLNAIHLSEICPKSAPNDKIVAEEQKKGTRKKPDSL